MKPIKGLRVAPPAAHDPSRKAAKAESRRAVRRAGERELLADLAQLQDEEAMQDHASIPDRFE